MLEDWKIEQILDNIFINNPVLGDYGLDHSTVVEAMRQRIYALSASEQEELYADVVGF